MTRMDIISPRARKDGKTFWLKIGAAFPLQNGGWSLVFDALPLPDAEGRCSVLMKEPTERRDTQDDYREKRPADDVDQDSVPF